MVKLACGVMPDFKDNGTQEAATPTDGTKLLRIAALLVDQVRLIEYLLVYDCIVGASYSVL